MAEAQEINTEKKDLESLLKNISEGLKFYSVKELNEAVMTVLNQKHDKREEIEFILNSVCDDFGITKKVLIRSSGRGNIQEARRMTYCLLHFNLGLPIRYIAKRIFFKWHNSVAIPVKKFHDLNPLIKPDREFKERYEKLQHKLATFVASNKQ